MHRDIEETLSRELREVASRVDVPVMPALPRGPVARPAWQPLLVAAVVVLVALATAATLGLLGGGQQVQPMPAPSPTRTTEGPTEVPTEDAGSIPTSRPTVPYVLGTSLFVAGKQLPGGWAYVEGVEDGWVAQRLDGTDWWGYDAEPQRLEGPRNQPPEVSPNGHYQASIIEQDGQGLLIGASTAYGGEGFGGVPIDLTDGNGAYTYVSAVTDGGLVITKGDGVSLLWRPLVDGKVIDLSQTAPDQLVLGNSPAGLVVVDGSGGFTDATQGEVYLAEISPDGELTRLEELPPHDDLVASRGWLAWAPPGTIGGEVPAISQLQVQRLDGSGRGTLRPPTGWLFRSGSWTWEDDDYLVAPVIDERGRDRMTRCSPATGDCVLADTR